MTIGSAANAAKRLAISIDQMHQYSKGRVPKRDEKFIRQDLEDVRRSLELLDQVAWRS